MSLNERMYNPYFSIPTTYNYIPIKINTKK